MWNRGPLALLANGGNHVQNARFNPNPHSYLLPSHQYPPLLHHSTLRCLTLHQPRTPPPNPTCWQPTHRPHCCRIRTHLPLHRRIHRTPLLIPRSNPLNLHHHPRCHPPPLCSLRLPKHRFRYCGFLAIASYCYCVDATVGLIPGCTPYPPALPLRYHSRYYPTLHLRRTSYHPPPCHYSRLVILLARTLHPLLHPQRTLQTNLLRTPTLTLDDTTRVCSHYLNPTHC